MLGRLLDLAAARIDVGHAGRLLAGGIGVDLDDVAERAQLEILLLVEGGQHRGEGIRLRALRADVARAEAAALAFEQHHLVEIVVVRVMPAPGPWNGA